MLRDTIINTNLIIIITNILIVIIITNMSNFNKKMN